jgi:hypothetical protein
VLRGARAGRAAYGWRVTVERLLTARQIASAFGFNGPAWVLRHSRPGMPDPMPCYRMGADCGPVRYRASEVEAWLGRRQANMLSERKDTGAPPVEFSALRDAVDRAFRDLPGGEDLPSTS